MKTHWVPLGSQPKKTRQEGFQNLRAAEIKHGRVPWMAGRAPKNDGFQMDFLFQGSIFRGYVSFREGKVFFPLPSPPRADKRILLRKMW